MKPISDYDRAKALAVLVLTSEVTLFGRVLDDVGMSKRIDRILREGLRTQRLSVDHYRALHWVRQTAAQQMAATR
jgi:hypothetical protein